MLPRRFRVSSRVGVVVQSSRRRAFSILYVGLLMVGVFGLVSLRSSRHTDFLRC